MGNGKERTEKKKKKKGKSTAVKIVGKTMNADLCVIKKAEKKRKREKNKRKDLKDGEVTNYSTRKKLKGSETEGDKMSDDKGTNDIKSNSKDPKPEKKQKKISFSDQVEVFPLEGRIVQGKRFPPEEDEMNSIHIGNRKERPKKKKKKIGEKGESTAVEVVGKIMNADSSVSEKSEKKRKREKNKRKDGEVTNHSSRKRFKASETEGDKMNDDKEINYVRSNFKDPKSKKKKKKVGFSDQVEVFSLEEGRIVQGRRFSPEEDEMIKQAVYDYINSHDLGDEGLTMVLNCKSHSKVKNCWKEIAEALPHRPYISVYDRAHILFERDETRTWNSEDFEIIRKYYAEHGPKWRQLADAMGKHRRHIKDAWRRTKLPNRKRGHWSQEEYQTLFDLVNIDLRAKVYEEKKSKHGMLKDNICWSAISDKLASRNFVACCVKWYNQLTSSMVKNGEWADTDDYHLIDALYTLDACCIEDVDWDSLLEHRSGDLCLKRWKQMANHIGEHGKKSFVEQVEILSKRYCPELLEARETWDNKPVIP